MVVTRPFSKRPVFRRCSSAGNIRFRTCSSPLLFETGLSKQRCLLISCRSCNWNPSSEKSGICFSVNSTARLCLGQHAFWNIQLFQNLIIPLQRIDIKQHRPGCIGIICDMHRPFVSFQINQVSTVPNSNSPRFARSLAPSTWSKIHFTFVPENKRRSQARSSSETSLSALYLSGCHSTPKFFCTARQSHYTPVFLYSCPTRLLSLSGS